MIAVVMAVPASVVVYTTTWCPYCVLAKRLLDKKRVDYREIDVQGRSDLRQWLAQVSRQRTVPQIFINGVSIGGFEELAALERRGELDRLLAEPASPDDAALQE